MPLVETGMEILNKLTRGHAERLLRFVHARLALPGLSGVVDVAPLTMQPRQ